jgi:hypothetical protein
MAQFEMNLAVAGNLDPGWLPEFPLRVPDPSGARRSLEEVYASASSGKIELRPDHSAVSTPFIPERAAVGAADLQAVLQEIATNPPSVWPVPRLGLIYAPFYRPKPGVYGLMFDRGISDPFDPTVDPASHRQAREGCAVFLGAIHQTGLERDDYENQVAFTTVHELGHVFNLEHFESAECFLNTSSLEAPLLSAFTFLREPQMDRLARVEFDRTVAPGGSIFGETGIFPHADHPAALRQLNANQLQIQAEIEPAEFWPWEPVELDVTLIPGPAFEKLKLSIPDEIDPGYQSFEIWIEEPFGERRRYRPLRHYCALPAKIICKAGKPWRRDISIFCEAGGYTFRQTGTHRVWVRFRISPKEFIESKPFSISIKQWPRANARARNRLEEEEKLLRRSRHTLYYRSGRRRDDEVEALHTLRSKFRGEHAGGSALYALARFCASQAMHNAEKSDLRWAADLLERAAQHPAISEQRRRNARRIARELRAIKSAVAGRARPRPA